jgi:hypothetical protein
MTVALPNGTTLPVVDKGMHYGSTTCRKFRYWEYSCLECGETIEARRDSVIRGTGICVNCLCARNSTAQFNSAASTFKMKASSIHEDRFNYSDVVYKGCGINVVIHCKLHGPFEQTPSNHLAGNTCPYCAKSSFKTDLPGILYYLAINGGEAYKIGVTNRSVKERYSVEELSRIVILAEVHYLVGRCAYSKEQELLSKFKTEKYLGKPLLVTGNTELFSTDIRYIHKEYDNGSI